MSPRSTLAGCIASLGILISGGVCVSAGESGANSAAGTLASQGQPITFDEFLARVAANNLDLAAQRYNITIAQAQVVAAKVSHLNLLPQGKVEKDRRAVNLVKQMDAEGFGNCTVTGSCEAVCPKEISLNFIARMNREYGLALLKGEK